MKGIGLFLLAGFLLLPTVDAIAAKRELTPILILNHIKTIEVEEKAGDELYFDISVYRAKRPTEYLRVPKRPFHWLSQLTGQYSEVKLWSQPLKEGERTTLIVSLIEADSAPLNSDDLIGVMKVQLKNEGGVLRAHWTMPNHVKGTITTEKHGGHIQKFVLNGEGARYEVQLSLKK